MKKRIALLALVDGTIFAGYSFGAAALQSTREQGAVETNALRGFGEAVINTAMTGYPEVLTDRSYRGQLLVMTYPHIGNYGIDYEWSEARAQGAANDRNANDVQCNGFIVRALSQAQPTDAPRALHEYLASNGVPAICDVDTRALTLHIRDKGALLAAIVAAPDGFARWGMASQEKATGASHGDTARLRNDFADYYATLQQYLATLKAHYRYDLVTNMPSDDGAPRPHDAGSGGNIRAVLYDCGAKRSITACLADAGCSVEVASHSSSADTILAHAPDLVVLSNGPGDPAPLETQVACVKELIGKVPILAICMGNQLLSQALGARTYKLPFGHHGVNHPVSCSTTARLYVTSQNHEYAVDEESLPSSVEVWFRNTNDNSIEGIIDRKRHLYSVQFHPESAPGPHDTRWIFQYVLKEIGTISKVA